MSRDFHGHAGPESLFNRSLRPSPPLPPHRIKGPVSGHLDGLYGL
jgi:hypothetical protein